MQKKRERKNGEKSCERSKAKSGGLCLVGVRTLVTKKPNGCFEGSVAHVAHMDGVSGSRLEAAGFSCFMFALGIHYSTFFKRRGLSGNAGAPC